MNKINIKKNSKIKVTETENNKSKYHLFLYNIIIFSILGFFLESIFCIIEQIKFKDEFGFILGPLSLCYGISASIIILILDKFKSNKIKIFFLGGLLGCLIEFIGSYCIEALLGVKLWNTSWSKYQLNGRVCLEHFIVWAIVTNIIFIINKFMYKKIIKLTGKKFIILDTIISILIVLYVFFIGWGIKTYSVRAKELLNGKNYTSNNNFIEIFENKFFTNRKFEILFKNMEIKYNSSNRVIIKDINKTNG